MKIWNELMSWLFPERGTGQDQIVAAYQVESLLASLLTMAWIVEARDPYTGGHLWRVSRYARLLAEKSGFDDGQAAMISLGGFLHDLGKIGVPDAILRKPDRLTTAEYDVMKTHPDIGVRLLAGHPLAEWVRDAVWLHHERPDGFGYPHQLKANDIPDSARIVGICDAFDAMTSHRPYRSALSKEKALFIIKEGLGTQFDSVFAKHFLALGETNVLDDIIGHSDEGIPLQSCPMCGPTLVIRRQQKAGEMTYCPNCGGQFELIEKHNKIHAIATGKQGNAQDLSPTPDTELIAKTIRFLVLSIPIEQLLQVAQPTREYHA